MTLVSLQNIKLTVVIIINTSVHLQYLCVKHKQFYIDSYDKVLLKSQLGCPFESIDEKLKFEMEKIFQNKVSVTNYEWY